QSGKAARCSSIHSAVTSGRVSSSARASAFVAGSGTRDEPIIHSASAALGRDGGRRCMAAFPLKGGASVGQADFLRSRLEIAISGAIFSCPRDLNSGIARNRLAPLALTIDRQ